jgi:hypothetical protein
MELQYVIAIAAIVISIAIAFLIYSWKSASNSNFDEIPSEQNQFVPENFQDILNNKRDDDILGGKTDKYDWHQNDQEVEVYLKVVGNVGAKQVNCKILKDNVKVLVNGVVALEGDFYAPVIPEECNWQMDGDGENRKIWITLHKEAPTTRNQHWKYVIEGDEAIDTSRLGPPVHRINTDSKEDIREAMRKVISLL